MRRLQNEFDLTVIVNTEDVHFLKPLGVNARVIPVRIERRISPARDLLALLKLAKLFRKEQFDILHSIMPKSGLLSMVAGFYAGIPVRVHTFTGQVWKNDRGLKRFVLKSMDKLIACSSTNILVDSPSQREFIIGEHVVSRFKSSVLAEGSICGVDLKRFCFDRKARKELRGEWQIKDDDIVFFYLGRLKKDKGILDLAKAFSILCGKYDNIHLLIVGPDEEDMADRIKANCAEYQKRVTILGFTESPEKCLSAVDVFCLPSYREGFGQVIVEAAAVGIPSIGSRIYGITDTIEDGTTGFLFDVANHKDLAQKMAYFVESPVLIKQMGTKARENVAVRYSQEKITLAMENYYRQLQGL